MHNFLSMRGTHNRLKTNQMDENVLSFRYLIEKQQKLKYIKLR